MNDRQVSRDIVVDAPPSAVFEVLADPRAHGAYDGSGTVRSATEGPRRLGLGDRFGMSMRAGLPYTMVNEVVELEPDRRIAWQPRPVQTWAQSFIGGRIWVEDGLDGSGTSICWTLPNTPVLSPPETTPSLTGTA